MDVKKVQNIVDLAPLVRDNIATLKEDFIRQSPDVIKSASEAAPKQLKTAEELNGRLAVLNEKIEYPTVKKEFRDILGFFK